MRTYKLDGHLREATQDDIREGHILRMVQVAKGERDPRDLGIDVHSEPTQELVVSAFSDHIIVQIERPDLRGMGPHDGKYTWVKLARPYLYVHLTGTTSPSVLAGLNEYKVEINRLCGKDSLFRLVLMSTGKPAVMNLDR